MFSTRRRRQDAATDAFLTAIRTSAQPATGVPLAGRTDTARMPRIVLQSATPPGGWARARQDLALAAYRAARVTA